VTESGFVPLFDGAGLTGWRAIPRTYGRLYPGGPQLLDVMTDFPRDYNEQAEAHPAAWTVEDGAIVGRQDPPGSGWGGYLITERSFGDFELRLEANPDWPADTGVMVRRRRDSWEGLQVLLDHRQSGSIGGFYGNGIGGFHAVPFAVDVVRDAAGTAVGLRGDDPATSVEPFTDSKRAMLTKSADLEAFLAAWRFGEWNEFRIVCVGNLPVVTVWINDLLTAEIDLASLKAPNYAADAVSQVLGPRGHIALEVHDTDPMLREGRWGREARCRWRNIRIREL
jgi:3-keto-disaccharide hydrolase